MPRLLNVRNSGDRQRFGSRGGIARQAPVGHDVDSLPVDQEFLPFDAFLDESGGERHSSGCGIVDPVSEFQAMQSARCQDPVRDGGRRTIGMPSFPKAGSVDAGAATRRCTFPRPRAGASRIGGDEGCE